MNAMEDGLQAVYDHYIAAGDIQVTTDFAKTQGFDTDEGFFPWITRRPDSSVYGIENMQEWGPLNFGLLSDMRARLDQSLASGRTSPCTTIELGDPADTYSVNACSRNLTDDYYVTYMTWTDSIGSVICDGSADSACNVWLGANLLGDIMYAAKSGESEALKLSFATGEFDYGSITVALVNQAGYVWSASNASMPWNTADLQPFTTDSVTYKGWNVPLTLDGVEFKVSIFYPDVAEPLFPVSNWASLGSSLSTSCSPLTTSDSCDAADIASYILGSITQASGSNSTSDLIQMIFAGDFNFGAWVPELRRVSDGSVVTQGPNVAGSVGEVTMAEEVIFVAQQVLATDGQSFVEYSAAQGPLRTYVVPVGSDYFAQVSYVNSALTSTTTSSQPETTESSAFMFGWLAAFSFAFFW